MNSNRRKGNIFSGRWPAFFLVIVLASALCGLSIARAASAQDVILFTDLQDHWARSHVMRMGALEVVKGYPDHTYKPDQLVNRLETVVLIIRSGGFVKEAEGLATSRGKSNGSGSAANSNSAPTPRVSWGQSYLDLAVEKGFLSLVNPDDFNAADHATRLEVAKLLARALYLVPPSFKSETALGGKDSLPGVGLASVKAFSDETPLHPDDLACIRAVAVAGVMSGYPDGTFRPGEPLTRAELAVILSRLVDRGWVKIPTGRRLTGWISSIDSKKGSQEIAFTSLSGVQKLKVAKVVQCYQAEEERPLEQAANYRCEVILDGSRQASWINLLEQKSSAAKFEKVRGSVKMVALGEDNLLVLNDMNYQDLVLPLAWDAVVGGVKTAQGFKSLKPGSFVDVEMDQGQVKKVIILEVKTVSGKVDNFMRGRLYLKGGLSGNKPGWFNYYDRARMVNKDGVRKGYVSIGDQVRITYLDPFPSEIDDEIALEIKVAN